MSSRLERQPHRHDPELAANKRKREAAERLAELADEGYQPPSLTDPATRRRPAARG
ncbi:hypothetical protein JBE27_43805 [Streptomyces albiflaviniger]|nr:hypothetical protein [Streptomyces albiflaviniger]